MKFILAAAIALAACTPAFAAAPCGNLAEITAYLGEKYGEHEAVAMISARGPAVIIYANAETGTYTTLSVPPSQPGIACVIDAGTGFTASVGNPA
jgi:hypothetical protein